MTDFKDATPLEIFNGIMFAVEKYMGIDPEFKPGIAAIREALRNLTPQEPGSGEVDDEGLGLAHYSTVKQLQAQAHSLAGQLITLKIQLGTEQEMHKAWRKRAEEAEAALSEKAPDAGKAVEIERLIGLLKEKVVTHPRGKMLQETMVMKTDLQSILDILQAALKAVSEGE